MQILSLTTPDSPMITAQHRMGAKSHRFGHIPLQPSKIAEIIKHPEFAAHLEDIVGFGLVRTLFNAFRMYLFESVDKNERRLNWPAAREWSIRELGNQFCANFLSGLSMVGLASLVRGVGKPHIADQFASNDTIALFRHLVQSSHNEQQFIQGLSDTIAKASPAQRAEIQQIVAKTLGWMQQKTALNEAGFIRHLAQQLAPSSAQEMESKIKGLYQAVRHNPVMQTADEGRVKIKTPDAFVEAIKRLKIQKADVIDQVFKPAESAAVRLAKLLKQKDFDISRVIGGQSHRLQLNALLEDAHQFLAAIQKYQHVKPWSQAGMKLLNNTVSIKSWAVPLALAVGMIGTMAVPYINKSVTEKVDKIDDYVGEMGLRDLKKVDNTRKKTWLAHAFPYLTEEGKKGNWIPFLISLLPLPFALGMFDNGALHAGQWAKAFNKPGKGFFARMSQMFQFRKGFPYMTPHQLLALCALVCTARVLTSRDKIEMRERLVDSYGGWFVWAIAFGWLKKALSGLLDRYTGSRILEKTAAGFVFRADEHIQHFLPKEIAQKTLKAQSWMKGLSSAILIATVGIIEPYIALKWTEYQVREEQKKQTKKRTAPVPQSNQRAMKHASLDVLPGPRMVHANRFSTYIPPNQTLPLGPFVPWDYPKQRSY